MPIKSSRVSSALLIISSLSLTTGYSASNSSIAVQCKGYTFPNAVCINRYGSTMPSGIHRQVNYTIGFADTYHSTSVPGDASFGEVAKATFIVWDQARGSEVLGSDPVYEYMFTIDPSGHEAPVYVPTTNELYFSQLKTGFLPQLVVDLNNEPPTISEKLADPPIYAPAGARYRNGKIYFASGGGNGSLGDRTYRPGIYSLDPVTGKSETVVNNYYGWYFNTADDLDIDNQGRIWFTDNLFARNDLTDTEAPQIQAASYRYDPGTGAVNIVDDTMIAPNGIAFSPDRRTLYFTDTAAGVPMIDPLIPLKDVPSLQYNSTNKRTLYAFDVSNDGLYLQNRRPLYTAMDFVPDGLKVASNGYILTGAGHGIDIIDPSGTHLLRIQTNFTAVNVDFTGPDRDYLWIVGHGAVARVKLNLTGPVWE